MLASVKIERTEHVSLTFSSFFLVCFFPAFYFLTQLKNDRLYYTNIFYISNECYAVGDVPLGFRPVCNSWLGKSSPNMHVQSLWNIPICALYQNITEKTYSHMKYTKPVVSKPKVRPGIRYGVCADMSGGKCGKVQSVWFLFNYYVCNSMAVLLIGNALLGVRTLWKLCCSIAQHDHFTNMPFGICF